MNPLFPEDEWHKHAGKGHPTPEARQHAPPADPAIELIRRKIDHLYANEPSAKQELAALELANAHRSKHQQFMYRLSTSGQPLAKIQAAWHEYYSQLPDKEKHEVWQEFYSANARHRNGGIEQPAPQPILPEEHQTVAAATHDPYHTAEPTGSKRRGVKSIKKALLGKVSSSGLNQTKAKQHLHSLLFGLGLGGIVLVVTLFGLFNQVIITPFIKPGSGVGNTPIILNANEPAPSDATELIIPKINAQLPVIYDNNSMVESDIQKSLEEGVFHYPTTAQPGSNGNAAIFGHSSNNIFNKGKYKFAFVLLRELEPGDIFYLTYEKKVYTYKVYEKKVVNPEDTWVLRPVEGKTATATLITCDPPGTSKHRLVVWGEQVNPDPSGNTAQAEPSEVDNPGLPGNGPGPFTRFWRWLF